MTYLGKEVFLVSMTILEENKGWEEEGRGNQDDLVLGPSLTPSNVL